MNPDEFKKSLKRIDEPVTLSKFLSQLSLSLTEKDRVVVYDDSCNMVFDSDAPDWFMYYEMWEVLEETVCQVSDVTENGSRTVVICLAY